MSRSVHSRTVSLFLSLFPAQSHSDVPDCGLYTYRAEITWVIDGDTIVVNIDLGFNTWLHDKRLRLVGIDAPENKTVKGLAATKALKARIEGKHLYICTIKAKRSDNEAKGSFGRYLVEVFESGESVNQWPLREGWAIPYDQ